MIYDESHWKKKGKREVCFKIWRKKIISKNNENEESVYLIKNF